MQETLEEEQQSRRGYVIRSLKARADAKRTFMERFADWMTKFFGSIFFLIVNAIWFVSWILINIGWVPGVEPFDPFPFGLLTMVVSLEAIILAIIVLISQNRAAKIAELREEVDLQINTFAEEEITKMIKLQLLLLKKNGVNVDNDPELSQMVRHLDSTDIEHRIEKQLSTEKHNHLPFNK